MNPADLKLLQALDGAQPTQAVVIERGQSLQRHDWLAEEVAVALVFNGISHAVMMATPLDLEDFALGFALTEGLIDHATDLLDIEAVPSKQGIELQLQVTAACMVRLKERRRTLAGRTGCGLCGTDSLAQVQRVLPHCPPVVVSTTAVTHAQSQLQSLQILQQHTGATHAAAWCNLQGEVLALREDVGRHNALDKLIGQLVRRKTDTSLGFALITSRASFEMVQKAAMAGMGLLAAVSAPTALAVQTAQSCGLALAGFVRGERLVAYTHAERFTHGH
jgi:FdhD protein